MNSFLRGAINISDNSEKQIKEKIKMNSFNKFLISGALGLSLVSGYNLPAQTEEETESSEETEQQSARAKIMELTRRDPAAAKRLEESIVLEISRLVMKANEGRGIYGHDASELFPFKTYSFGRYNFDTSYSFELTLDKKGNLDNWEYSQEDSGKTWTIYDAKKKEGIDYYIEEGKEIPLDNYIRVKILNALKKVNDDVDEQYEAFKIEE